MFGPSRGWAALAGVAALGAALLAPPRTPAAPDLPGTALSSLRAERERQLLLAGHLLRRLGFGPNRRETHEVLRLGLAAYTERQLHPAQIDDRVGERLYRPTPGPDGVAPPIPWFSRMVYSRRQLQEKMTLIWHEHFPISFAKVLATTLLRDNEQLLRDHALGSFRDLLIAITKDNAMLRYLDNHNNNGRAVDPQGDRKPPNENYARELLQLFSLGVNQLNADGTPLLDADGKTVPAYTETDVKEIARALTGWRAHYPSTIDPENPNEYIPPAQFVPSRHDFGQKVVLGEVIPADVWHGEADVERVVDIIMHQPSTAPFISRELILKLATETPSPAYVERVAAVFAARNGDLGDTVRAILTDAEFYSPSVVASQFKTPVEHVIGALRGLDVVGPCARAAYYATLVTGELVYYPPSVFGFYRPGHKGSLVNAATVVVRDQVVDTLSRGDLDPFFDVFWDASGMIRRQRLAQRPDRAVDLLAQSLLAASQSPESRQALIDYMGPTVTEEKLRGAAWLIMSSPEYQVN